MTATAGQVLAKARPEIGTHEGRDPNGNWNNDVKYARWYGMNRQAWCAMFVSWVAFQAGATDIIPRFAYTPSGAAWFKAKGRYGNAPKVGAIGFLSSQGLGIHHTFFVEAVHSGGTFTTIEGNTNTTGSAQGDGVYRLTRRVGPSYTFGYPAYAAAPQVSLVNVVKASQKAPHLSAPGATLRVQRALHAEGLLGGYVPGRFGKATKIAYAAWQRTKAGGSYRGAAADGIPGRDSLRRLGRRHDFVVV